MKDSISFTFESVTGVTPSSTARHLSFLVNSTIINIIKNSSVTVNSSNETSNDTGVITFSNYDTDDMPVTMDTDDLVVSRILLPIVCLCGIAGILLTIIVLSQKHMSTSTNCYLLALSAVDLVFLVLLTTTMLYHVVDKNDEHVRNIMEIYITLASVVMMVFLMASIWLTVVLAIERYVAICQPFLAAKVMNSFICLLTFNALKCNIIYYWYVYFGNKLICLHSSL